MSDAYSRVVAVIGGKDDKKLVMLMCIDCGHKIWAPSKIVGEEMRRHKLESNGRCV